MVSHPLQTKAPVLLPRRLPENQKRPPGLLHSYFRSAPQLSREIARCWRQFPWCSVFALAGPPRGGVEYVLQRRLGDLSLSACRKLPPIFPTPPLGAILCALVFCLRDPSSFHLSPR